MYVSSSSYDMALTFENLFQLHEETGIDFRDRLYR
jgi:hypothetical protein